MSTTNPVLYTFPRNRESEAEPLQVSPESEAPGDHSLFPASNMFASSISALLMNLGGIEDGQVPELVLLNTERLQIWFDNTHLIEADSRRATVGKYYLDPIGEVTLYRVEDIQERSVDEFRGEISDRAKDRIDGPADALILQHCYTLTDDETGPYDGISECLPRVMFERDGSLGGYIDSPPIPFVELSEAITERDHADESQRLLSEFD